MFIFKKVLSNFFFPVPLVLILLFTGIFLLWSSRREKIGKVFVTAGSILLLLLSNNFVSEQILGPLEKKHPPQNLQLSSVNQNAADILPIKYIVVLGGGHVSTSTLPLTGQIDRGTLARLVEAVIIHKKRPGSHLILSGGAVFDPVPNARIMADVARELGVPEEHIITEERSMDTKDEALLIKSIVKEEPFILVTSASHMPRAIALFKKQGMDPIPAPTAHLVKSSENREKASYFPSASALHKSTRGFYEYMGIAWAALRGQL